MLWLPHSRARKRSSRIVAPPAWTGRPGETPFSRSDPSPNARCRNPVFHPRDLLTFARAQLHPETTPLVGALRLVQEPLVKANRWMSVGWAGT